VTVTYREDRAGIQAMLISRWMVDAMGDIAETGRTRAILIAPVRSGRYASHFRIWKGIRAGRAFAVYYNGVASKQRSAKYPSGFVYAIALELGTSKMRKQRILLKSIDGIRVPPHK
jgi:hypothetical protein